MLVLEIGAGPKPKAEIIPGWEDATIETMDADEQYEPTYLCDASNPPKELEGKFDGILASHILEHVVYWDAPRVLGEWVKMLKDDGELHIVVPSLEWAAAQALLDKPSRALFPHLFAGHVTKWDQHHSMYTMRLLRQLMESAGIATMRARTASYPIKAFGEVVLAEEHYVMGVKYAKESV